jgi:hypothetical protein
MRQFQAREAAGAYLQYSVKGGLQRAGPVGGKEAEQDALRRQVVQQYVLAAVSQSRHIGLIPYDAAVTQ